MSCIEFNLRQAFEEFRTEDMPYIPDMHGLLKSSGSPDCEPEMYAISSKLMALQDNPGVLLLHEQPMLFNTTIDIITAFAKRMTEMERVDWEPLLDGFASTADGKRDLKAHFESWPRTIVHGPTYYPLDQLRWLVAIESNSLHLMMTLYERLLWLNPKEASKYYGQSILLDPTKFTLELQIRAAWLDLEKASQVELVKKLSDSDTNAVFALPAIIGNSNEDIIDEACVNIPTTKEVSKFYSYSCFQMFKEASRLWTSPPLKWADQAIKRLLEVINQDWNSTPLLDGIPYVTSLDDIEYLFKYLSKKIKLPNSHPSKQLINDELKPILDSSPQLMTRELTSMFWCHLIHSYFTTGGKAIMEEFIRLLPASELAMQGVSEKLMEDSFEDTEDTKLASFLLFIHEGELTAMLYSFVTRHAVYFAKSFYEIVNKIAMMPIEVTAIEELLGNSSEMTQLNITSRDNFVISFVKYLKGLITSHDIYRLLLFEVLRNQHVSVSVHEEALIELLESHSDAHPSTEPYPLSWFSRVYMGGELSYREFCKDAVFLNEVIDLVGEHPAADYWKDYLASAIADHFGTAEWRLVQDVQSYPDASKIREYADEPGNEGSLNHRDNRNCSRCTTNCGMCRTYDRMGDMSCLVVDHLSKLWNGLGVADFAIRCDKVLGREEITVEPSDTLTAEETEVIERRKKELLKERQDAWNLVFATVTEDSLEDALMTAPEETVSAITQIPKRYKLWIELPRLLKDVDTPRAIAQREEIYKHVIANLDAEMPWPAVAMIQLGAPPSIGSDDYIMTLKKVSLAFLAKLSDYKQTYEGYDQLRDELYKRTFSDPEFKGKLITTEESDDSEEFQKIYSAIAPHFVKRLREEAIEIQQREEVRQREEEEERQRRAAIGDTTPVPSTPPIQFTKGKEMAEYLAAGLPHTLKEHWEMFIQSVPTGPNLAIPIAAISEGADWKRLRKLLGNKLFAEYFRKAAPHITKVTEIPKLCTIIDADYKEMQDKPLSCDPDGPFGLLIEGISAIGSQVLDSVVECIPIKLSMFRKLVQTCDVDKGPFIKPFNPYDKLAPFKDSYESWTGPNKRLLAAAIFIQLEAVIWSANVSFTIIDEILNEALPPSNHGTDPINFDEGDRDNAFLSALGRYAKVAITEDPENIGYGDKFRLSVLEKAKMYHENVKVIVLQQERKLLMPMAEGLSKVFSFEKARYITEELQNLKATSPSKEQILEIIEMAFLEGDVPEN